MKNGFEHDGSRRFGIFICHDVVIQKYVLYLLQDMKENLSDLIVVFRGATIAPESRRALYPFTDQILLWEKGGYDAAAWKFVMTKYLGWERMGEYDEIVLFNDTFYGPFVPFRDVFDDMAKRDVDFWGLTCRPEMVDAASSHEDGIPSYIQAYFLVLGRRMHRSYEFREYWDQMPEYETYEDVHKKIETVFTKHFESMGFSWDVYVDLREHFSKKKEKNYRVDQHEANWMISRKHCPVLRRSLFAQSLRKKLSLSMGNDLYKCLDYISKQTEYHVDLIWEDILRRYDVSDIFHALGLQYILPTDDMKIRSTSADVEQKTLLILFLYYMDQLEYIKEYVDHVPTNIRILMITNSKERKDKIEAYFSGRENISFRQVEPRGRDFAGLLMGAGEEIRQYEYICFCHDKRSSHIESVTGADFQESLWENLLGSKEYILNVLDLFQRNPRMGLAVPPHPAHGEYSFLVGNAWTGNFEQVRELCKKLGIRVPLHEDRNPLSLGSCFWCRREALQPLWEYSWSYEDFPEEPMGIDFTLNHALERVLPFVAQHSGFYTAWIMTPEAASIEARNMRYMAERMAYCIRHDRDAFPGISLVGVEERLLSAPPKKASPENIYDHFFPYHLFHRGTRVALYGAGNIGRQFYRQAKHDGFVEIVGIVDKNAGSIELEDIPVQTVDALREMEYDYVLITMNRPEIVEDGKRTILDLGIEEKKIKWDGTVYYRDHFYQNAYFPLLERVGETFSGWNEIMEKFREKETDKSQRFHPML